MSRRTRSAAATGLVLLALTFMTLQGLLFYRPLPVIDGYYRFLGLDQQAEVVRDVFGIPRIEAGTVRDLFFLQGYVTAQDRFAQMEEMRARASSTFSNMPAALDPATIAALEAYAEGVTKYIDQHSGAGVLPAEIRLSGRDPRAWTPADSLGIAELYLARTTAGRPCTVVPGEMAFSGRPMLAADLRVEAPAPGWYEIGSAGPGHRAVGISFPGVPGIVAGHNGLVAWSVAGARDPAPVTRNISLMISAGGASSIETLVDTGAGPACVADIHGSIRSASGGIQGPPLRGGSATLVDVESMRLAFDRVGATDAAARIVIDLGDLDASRAALSTGQSGHPVAYHYRDQAQLWTAGQLHRLAWTPAAIARTAGRLVLRPR